MNRKKIVLTASTLIIAAVGVFASVKKSPLSAVYFKSTGNSCLPLINSAEGGLFTSAGSHQATIKTVGGTLLSLFSTSTCTSSHPAYLKN